MRSLLTLLFLGLLLHAQAVQLRVFGPVTDLETRVPLSDVLVRVYKDGVKQKVFTTGGNGHYSVLLDNGASYVLRFSQPGRVTKCYAIDTHGPAWEGDNRVVDLSIEMTLFPTVSGLDLTFFDLPMGVARFTPMTGYLSWNDTYALDIREEVDRLMAEVALRRQALAVLDRRSLRQ
jgi:hypothetical protein